MTILVTGASGTVGQRLVSHLLEAGQEVRALTRNPDTTSFASGVEVISGDLAKPQTLAPALDGVSGLHLITFSGDYFSPLANAREIRDIAESAGVRRVTVLRGNEPDSVREVMREGDFACAILAPVEFMSNCLNWADTIRREGVVREAFGHVRSAMVHESDIAAVAAAALSKDGHDGMTYTITGPEGLTVPDQVRILGEALGREIEYVELSEDEARAKLRDEGQSEEAIAFFMQMGKETPSEGYTVLDTVERITGRPPRTFAQWAWENAHAFIPNPNYPLTSTTGKAKTPDG